MHFIIKTTLLLLLLATGATAQTLTGRIISATSRQPLVGAGLQLKLSGLKTTADNQGRFSLKAATLPDTLIITYIGYQQQRLAVGQAYTSLGNISLSETTAGLQEVTVNTGYYQVAKERATGSFSQVSNQLLNRTVSTNILDRLEGVTSGLQFERRLITDENPASRQPELRVRGLSTIAGGAYPLIIVDNFPYEGDISSINPNDIESVTVLKDAAAASIWGARAGNGVIVINTRQGRYNQQVSVSVNASLNLLSKPDLFYGKEYLPSALVMDFQRELFNRGAYTDDDRTYIPTYVELLIKRRDNLLSEPEFQAQQSRMQQTDFRRQASQYFYQTGINQQYAFNVNGGGSNYKYFLSAGYDQNKSNQVAKTGNRINLSFQNSFKLNKSLELSAGIWYSLQNAANNSITYSNMGNGVREPYTLLADESGNALPTGYFGRRQKYIEQAPGLGLMDWMYRPLDEPDLNDNTESNDEIRINTGIRYSFLRHFNFNATYQHIRANSSSQVLYDANSYYVRNLVNRFTQANGQLILPKGDILQANAPGRSRAHSGRMQFNYDQTIAAMHQFTALAGAEINQRISQTLPGFRLYNYSEETLGGTQQFNYTQSYPVRPNGTALIERPPGSVSKTNSRNLSYFSNAAYTYHEKYTLSGSARWDGSNLLGVKTNQRGTLLWSAGLSWNISKENFYKLTHQLPYLRLRATYGSGGLIDKSQSQYPTISLSTDAKTGLPLANLDHPGNPSLSWEQVNTLNLGLDWALKNNRISGSFEVYNKAATNLLGSILIDPTTGAGSNYKRNYADLNTKGMDLQLNSINFTLPVRWESSLLISYSRNKIKNYSTPALQFSYDYFNETNRPPVAGRSVDAIYALPWNGLDHSTGLPIIYIDGNQSTDYAGYTTNFKPEDLVLAGLDVAPWYGSLRNTFSFKGIEFSALLSFKAGYVFRRKSMEPGAEYVTGQSDLHTDYYLRWQQPGDELHTNVPAGTSTFNAPMGNAYSRSATLITSGNHIRLQDLNLSYQLPQKLLKSLQMKHTRFFISARNLALIWAKNKQGIDPEYPNASYPAPKTIAFGIQAGI